jgi:hypothetical protein
VGDYKKQHFIPQFYLRSFANDYKIYCYDKVRDVSYQTTVKDIAQQNHFYEAEELIRGTIEKIFNKKDQLFNTVYLKLLQKKDIYQLSEYERDIFFVFIAIQILRTDEFRSTLQNVSDQAINKLAEKTGVKVPDGYMIYTHPESTKRMHLRMVHDRAKVIDFSDSLSIRKWILFENDTGYPLWTSDNPVTMDNGYSHELGILSKGSEIHFPLTPDLCLTSFDPSTHRPPNNNKMEFLNIDYNNMLQVTRSKRFIYSSTNDFTLARMFLRDYPFYKDPYRNRMKVY